MQEKFTFLSLPVELKKIIFKLLSSLDLIKLVLVNKQLKDELISDSEFTLVLTKARNDLVIKDVQKDLATLKGSDYSAIREKIAQSDFSKVETKTSLLAQLSRIKMESNGKEADKYAITRTQKKVSTRMKLTEKKSLSLELDKRTKELERKIMEQESKDRNKDKGNQIRSTKTF